MNSDPHESAAWRTFGMLDADEASSFDEAVRHDPDLKSAYREMDCLSAAVAVTTTIPIKPQAGQLERLHTRLGLNAPKHTNWLGISGWAAAAVLTMILVIDRGSKHAQTISGNTTVDPVAATPDKSLAVSHVPRTAVQATQNIDHDPAHEGPKATAQAAIAQDGDGKTVAKVETKRLIQEIEVLRGQLENFQKRDRQRFEPVRGMAWPIVMKMAPPGEAANGGDALALVDRDPPITAMLGDALTSASTPSLAMNSTTLRTSMETTLTVPLPPVADSSAIPIYDAARDAGTLVVNNLPATREDESYNLWVKTDSGANPIYVGQLPKSTANGSAESFDFSLGSTSIVPSGFILTKDLQGMTTAPSKTNTVLQGPQ